MNDAYRGVVTKFLFVVNFVAPIRTLRMNSNAKPWFDNDVLIAIGNCDKHYKKFKQSGKEIAKGNFKCAILLHRKIINDQKNFTLKKNIVRNKDSSKVKELDVVKNFWNRSDVFQFS